MSSPYTAVWIKSTDHVVELAGQIAETAMMATQRSEFRRNALRLLQKSIGFDLGWFLSELPREVDALDGSPDLPTHLSSWLSQLHEDELRFFAVTSTRELFDGLCQRRIDQLMLGDEFIRPLHISACATRLWIHRGSAASFVIARTGSARRFHDVERRTIDLVTPIICATDAQLGSKLVPVSLPSGLLTSAELAIVELAVRGLTNAEIARLVGCSTRTVRNHLVHVFRKLEVSNRTELAFVWRPRDREERAASRERELERPAPIDVLRRIARS